MYSYTVLKEVSNTRFIETCKVIENTMIGYIKSDLLIDVDGSLLQIYTVPDGVIRVYNDYTVYAVYVDSDIAIPAFSKYKI